MELDLAHSWHSLLAQAAQNPARVSGLTHNFYRHPARFSPDFAAAAIELFSRDGDAVLDPFMGGGTTIVEAFARGRVAYGSDLNELAVFVSRAKTTLLKHRELKKVARWICNESHSFQFRHNIDHLPEPTESEARNLSLPATRPIKKLVRFLLGQLMNLRSNKERRFARCIMLKTSQWALDGRRKVPSINEFKARLVQHAEEMILGMIELKALGEPHKREGRQPKLYCARAQELPSITGFAAGARVPLVVTSPPYPGVHMLYHRWQVQGRKETPAPYWITASRDGMGSAYYNFADRMEPSQARYFVAYEASLRAIRSVMSPNGVLVQMVACRDVERHLPPLMDAIAKSGFKPLGEDDTSALIWRSVPRRRWHAALKGAIATSKEVVLVHSAR